MLSVGLEHIIEGKIVRRRGMRLELLDNIKCGYKYEITKRRESEKWRKAIGVYLLLGRIKIDYDNCIIVENYV